jgi:hypothetical protein
MGEMLSAKRDGPNRIEIDNWINNKNEVKANGSFLNLERVHLHSLIPGCC